MTDTTLVERVAQLEHSNGMMLLALHDAIVRPKGVVPDTAMPFYDPDLAQRAEEWRCWTERRARLDAPSSDAGKEGGKVAPA